MSRYDMINQIIRDPNLRASDADREATADRLRQHHTDGRLDSEEFQERLDKCFAAKTGGELNDLLRDLPPDRAQSGRGSRIGRLGLWRVIVPLILVIVAVHVIVGVAVGLWTGPWLLIPLFFLARFLFFGYGFRRWSSRRSSAL